MIDFKNLNTDDAVFFYDTIEKGKPYVAETPRNHESLFLVTEGALLYEKHNGSALIEKGSVGYIERGSVDKSSAAQCQTVSYIAVNFSFERGNTQPAGLLPYKAVCSARTDYKYEKMFKKALNEYNSAAPGSQLICSGILREIIGELYNDYVFDNIDYSKLKKIKQAVDYLKENYHRSDLKICKLAIISDLSVKQFRRIFADVYNKNPYEFLREYRLNKSEIMLLYTQKSISEIAVHCGFSDVYSFSHCFKGHFGISPKSYREQT